MLQKAATKILIALVAFCPGLRLTSIASAAPTAHVAKRCVHYAYIAYPFRRPGSVPMSGDRQAYVKDCFAKNGDVPAPTPPPKPGR